MKRTVWVAIVAALLLTAGALAYAAHGYGSRYCAVLKAANLAREVKDRVAPIDCLEFWMNRYQGILGSLLAAGVALLLARPVFRQLREMNRQTAIAIRAVEEAHARELEAELKIVTAFLAVQRELQSIIDGYDEAIAFAQEHAPGYSNSYIAAIRKLDSYLRDVSALFARYSDRSTLSIARRDFLRLAYAYSSAADTDLTGFRNATFGADVDEGEKQMNAKQIAAARTKVERARKAVLTAHRVLSAKLKTEIKAQWLRVQDLRNAARSGK